MTDFSQKDVFEGVFRKVITSLYMTGKIMENIYFIEPQRLYMIDAEYPAIFFDNGNPNARSLIISVKEEPSITFWKPWAADSMKSYNLQDPTAYDKMVDDVRQFLLWSLEEKDFS